MNYNENSIVNNDFDLLIFTQRWPDTVCLKWKEKSKMHQCTIPSETEWTIHGIWPTDFHKIAPSYCNTSLHFNIKAIQDIRNKLKVKWVDVENGLKPESFWKHEWDKHGTCASILKSMSTERKYFQKGLDLLDKYNMTNILAKVDIFPGNEYSVNKILDGIKKILNVNTQVMCVKDMKEKLSYIFEIRICLNKALKLMNCDGIVDFPTDCDRSKKVIYPVKVPNAINTIQI